MKNILKMIKAINIVDELAQANMISAIDKLINDEEAAIDAYDLAIAQTQSEECKSVFEHIKEEEVEHLEELRALKEKVEGTYMSDSITNDSHKWEVGQRVRYEGKWYYVVNYSKGQWVLEPEDGEKGDQIRVDDAGFKVRELSRGFAIVVERYWSQYRTNAYVERVCSTLDEAEYERSSLERHDDMLFVIIDCNGKYYVRVS